MAESIKPTVIIINYSGLLVVITLNPVESKLFTFCVEVYGEKLHKEERDMSIWTTTLRLNLDKSDHKLACENTEKVRCEPYEIYRFRYYCDIDNIKN